MIEHGRPRPGPRGVGRSGRDRRETATRSAHRCRPGRAEVWAAAAACRRAVGSSVRPASGARSSPTARARACTKASPAEGATSGGVGAGTALAGGGAGSDEGGDADRPARRRRQRRHRHHRRAPPRATGGIDASPSRTTSWPRFGAAPASAAAVFSRATAYLAATRMDRGVGARPGTCCRPARVVGSIGARSTSSALRPRTRRLHEVRRRAFST